MKNPQNSHIGIKSHLHIKTKIFIMQRFITYLYITLAIQLLIIIVAYLMSKIVLGYWKVRGITQPLRHLLAYTGLQFQQVHYESPDKWFKEDKPSIGFDFPNLPYLIDGDFKLTESLAIAKYIILRSQKHDLLGKTQKDTAIINTLIGVMTDALKDIRGLFFNKEYQSKKTQLLEKARDKLNYIKAFVGDKPFTFGYLTLIDFLLVENLYYFQTLYGNERHNFEFWWRIRTNFEALPQIQAYYARENAISTPFLPPYAAIIPKLHHVRLGYWSIRGLGQVPRLLLSFFGVQFEDTRYTNGDKWFKEDKQSLGLSFPNMPYLIDMEFQITQAAAIQRYIINRWGKSQFLGKNIQDNARLQSFLSIQSEITGAVKGLFWNKDYEKDKGPLLEKYKVKLEQLNKFVRNQEWVLGYLSLADFVVAEDSHYIQRVYPEEYKSWTYLQNIRQRFNNLPQIVAYYKREDAMVRPFYPDYAVLHVED